jgi:truncated hemoglobin YjbI
MLSEMNNKDVDVKIVAEKAMADGELLSEILGGLKSKAETLRYNCHKVLMHISETNGEFLYHKWDYFEGLLIGDNSYRKMSAVQIIANLARVDTENRFEKIIDRFYGLLDDRSMIVAIYVASSSGKIVRAKPHLERKITERLLNMDKTHHSEGRKSLIKAGAIEGFAQYFTEATDKERILTFVRELQNCDSPKTRKAAQDFLRKWED